MPGEKALHRPSSRRCPGLSRHERSSYTGGAQHLLRLKSDRKRPHHDDMRHLLPIALLAVVAGCSSAPRQPLAVVVGIDTSGSAKRFLAAYAAVTAQIAGVLEPGLDELTVFRFDYEAREIYGTEPPMSLESFSGKLVQDLSGESPRRGTKPAEFFRRAADAADRTQLPVRIVFLGDGGNDDLSADGAHELRRAARRLGDNPRVLSVTVSGAVPGMREGIRSHMSPLGDKLRFVELDAVAVERL
jgi:hypothetical protein